MALIKCFECGKEVSDRAASCPHCGAPTVEPPTKSAVESDHLSGEVADALARGEAFLRTNDFLRAEETFSSALARDPKCINAWLGKARAIAYQTKAGAPTGQVRDFAFEDRSPAALLCISEAQTLAMPDGAAAVEQARRDIVAFTVSTLMRGAASVYEPMRRHRSSGILFTRVGPAAQIQVSFVIGKAVPLAIRCHELEPDNNPTLRRLIEMLAFCGADSSRYRAAAVKQIENSQGEWLIRVGEVEFRAPNFGTVWQWHNEGRVPPHAFVYHPLLRDWTRADELARLYLSAKA